MEAKVGNLKVVQTQALILPEGEEGWLVFTIEGWEAHLRICFETSDEGKPPQTIAISVEGDHAVLRLVNWKNSLGTATVKPARFATLQSGATVYFMATHWFVGNVNRLDLQFLLEAP